MLDKKTKERLMQKSKNEFFRYVASLSSNGAENMLFHTWNAYCGCRLNEQIELFDFEDDSDRSLWEKSNGKIDFKGCRFGMQIEDYGRKEITLRYLDLTRLTDMVKAEFDDIYQYVLVYPWCFGESLLEIIIHPVVKEIGILDPHVVGFNDSIINESML